MWSFNNRCKSKLILSPNLLITSIGASHAIAFSTCTQRWLISERLLIERLPREKTRGRRWFGIFEWHLKQFEQKKMMNNRIEKYRDSRINRNDYCYISSGFLTISNNVCRNNFFLVYANDIVAIQVQLFYISIWTRTMEEKTQQILITIKQKARDERREIKFFLEWRNLRRKLQWHLTSPAQPPPDCSLEIKLYLSLAEFFVTNKRQRLLM